jgi:hypothetical protein
VTSIHTISTYLFLKTCFNIALPSMPTSFTKWSQPVRLRHQQTVYEGWWVRQNTTVVWSWFIGFYDDYMFRPCLAIFRS